MMQTSANDLSDWADIIRKTFYDGGIEEIISYPSSGSYHQVLIPSLVIRVSPFRVCVNRFDDETKQSFLELYDKVDADFEMPIDEEAQS